MGKQERYRDSGSGETVGAERFDPYMGTWPVGARPWPDEQGLQPRDMTWGYLEMADGRPREHLNVGDWIITWPCGRREVADAETFAMQFEPISGDSGD